MRSQTLTFSRHNRLFAALCLICAPAFVPVSVVAQDASLESSSAIAQEDLPKPSEQSQLGDPPIPVGAVGGMGDINLYPRRIVLDRRQRIATIGLYNRVAAEGEYEITVRDLVMTPAGGLVPTNHPDAAQTLDRLMAAGNMMRWSPRRVRLLGNEAQIVRVMARPPADLQDGEYRSHFTVISVPQDENEGLSIDDAVNGESGGDGIGVSIRPRFAISIPVIMRVGDTTLNVTMDAPSFFEAENGPSLRINLNRSGTRSAYGDVIVIAEGVDDPVAIARGIGIYPEVDARQVDVAFRLDPERGPLPTGTKLTVRFVDDDVNPGETLASRELVVP